MDDYDTTIGAAAPWRRDPNGPNYICGIHDERFPAGRVCPKCGPGKISIAIPVDAFDDDVSQPPGTLSLAQHESSLCEMAEYAKRRAMQPQGKLAPALRIKFLDVAVKAHRAAQEMAEARTRREILLKLERSYRATKGASH